MEMNASINFKFENEETQKLVTEALDIFHCCKGSEYAHITDKLSEFKSRMRAAFGDSLNEKFIEEYSSEIQSLETLKINKAGSTTVMYLTGSNGEDFADDMASFLINLGAKSAKAKVKADYE